MPSFLLLPHPDTPCPAITAVEMTVGRAERLSLTYRLVGDVAAIRWPEPADPGRADELWKHTCFEAFLAPSGGGYREINLSPSGQWAAYAFDDYRAGMREAPAEVAIAARPEGLDAAVAIDLPGDWRVGLSAVIELIDGSKSYWALAHASGPPDFHNRDCFTAMLPAPERP